MRIGIEIQNLEEFRELLAQAFFNRSLAWCIRWNVCVCCGHAAYLFRDLLSLKEADISGLCQDCQDKVFGV